MSVHQTVIIGNVGKDPESRPLKGGGSVTNFSVAVNEYRGKDEDPAVFWYNVSAWGENAGTAKDFQKGDRVVVVGKMVTRKWEDKDGNERYSTELVADTYNGVCALAPIPKKQGSKSRRDDDDRYSRSKSKARRPVDDDIDDEIPF